MVPFDIYQGWSPHFFLHIWFYQGWSPLFFLLSPTTHYSCIHLSTLTPILYMIRLSYRFSLHFLYDSTHLSIFSSNILYNTIHFTRVGPLFIDSLLDIPGLISRISFFIYLFICFFIQGGFFWTLLFIYFLLCTFIGHPHIS